MHMAWTLMISNWLAFWAQAVFLCAEHRRWFFALRLVLGTPDWKEETKERPNECMSHKLHVTKQEQTHQKAEERSGILTLVQSNTNATLINTCSTSLNLEDCIFWVKMQNALALTVKQNNIDTEYRRVWVWVKVRCTVRACARMAYRCVFAQVVEPWLAHCIACYLGWPLHRPYRHDNWTHQQPGNSTTEHHGFNGSPQHFQNWFKSYILHGKVNWILVIKSGKWRSMSPCVRGRPLDSQLLDEQWW